MAWQLAGYCAATAALVVAGVCLFVGAAIRSTVLRLADKAERLTAELSATLEVSRKVAAEAQAATAAAKHSLQDAARLAEGARRLGDSALAAARAVEQAVGNAAAFWRERMSFPSAAATSEYTDEAGRPDLGGLGGARDSGGIRKAGDGATALPRAADKGESAAAIGSEVGRLIGRLWASKRAGSANGRSGTSADDQ